MARVLLLDDDPSLLDALTLAFEDAGHEVLVAADGVAGAELIVSEKPALLVSDINMPRLDGFALCKKLRAEGRSLPIILLTSRDTDIDECLGLELGADDYVTKPFSIRTLLLRVAALLRRTEARAVPEEARRLEVGRLSLSLDRQEVRFAGSLLEVTYTEFQLLDCLAQNPGVVLTRERILKHLRGDTQVDGRLVDAYVRRLRRKFEVIDPRAPVIDTIVGAGYRLQKDG